MILCISSSTAIASIYAYEGAMSYYKQNSITREHSEFLNFALEESLIALNRRAPQIEEIRLDIGPGSFTGIRASVAFAKALGYTTKAPIQVATSLQLLSFQNSVSCHSLIEAHRGLFYYFGPSSKQVELLDFPAVTVKLQEDPQQELKIAGSIWTELLPKLDSSLRNRLASANKSLQYPDARSLSAIQVSSLATLDWKTLSPLYIRKSSAEEVLEDKLRRGLSEWPKKS